MISSGTTIDVSEILNGGDWARIKSIFIEPAPHIPENEWHKYHHRIDFLVSQKQYSVWWLQHDKPVEKAKIIGALRHLAYEMESEL